MVARPASSTTAPPMTLQSTVVAVIAVPLMTNTDRIAQRPSTGQTHAIPCVRWKAAAKHRPRTAVAKPVTKLFIASEPTPLNPAIHGERAMNSPPRTIAPSAACAVGV